MSSKNCRAERPARRGRRGYGLAVFLCLCCGLALAQAQPRVGERATGAAAPAPPGVREIEWEALIPAGWNPRAALQGVDLAALSDNDPRANALLEQLRAAADRAPVVAALDGQRVRIAGFTVTLERDDKGIREFLLVPYFGACIHTPPPPPNQIVHVLPAVPLSPDVAIFPVWVTGTLRTVATQTAEGATGYRIADARVEPYPWQRRR